VAGIRLEGSVTGNVAEVNAANQLKVVPETNAAANPTNVGAVRMFFEHDAGTVTGTASLKSPKISLDSRQRVGLDTILFTDAFPHTTQNTSTWFYSAATMTASQPGAGTVNFGTVQGTAATHGAFMRTFQHFPLICTAPLSVKCTFGQFTAAMIANEEWRVGLGLPTVAGTPPTDAIYVLLDTAGLRGVAVFSGVVTQTANLVTLSSFTVGQLFSLTIVIGARAIEFWREGVLLGTLQTPAGNGVPVQAQSLPFFMQKLCTGSVANTNTMRVSDMNVSRMDVQSGLDALTASALANGSGNVGQNGHTQGKTSLYANSTAPVAVALTNTTAAFVGLGGQAAILPTLAVSTDGIIFSFQNPAPTLTIPGRNLLVRGVRVQGLVSVVLAGGPVLWQYTVAYGHTAVSLATLETASFIVNTTHAPRIVPIGFETYAAAAPVGTLGQGALLTLQVPLVVRPGEFFQICAKNGVGGVVTTTGAITVMASIDSAWA
jgi:hypothetical protein